MSWFSKWSPFKHFQTLNHSFIRWGPLLSCGENATDSCAYSNAEKTSAKMPGTKLRAASWAMAMPSEAKNNKEYTNCQFDQICIVFLCSSNIEFQNLNSNIYFIKEFCIFLSASLKDLSGQHWVIGRSPSSQRAIKSLLWLQRFGHVWTCWKGQDHPRSLRFSSAAISTAGGSRLLTQNASRLHALSLVKVLQAPSKTRPRQQMTWGTPASMKAPGNGTCGSIVCIIFCIILKILYLDLVPWVPSCPILAMPCPMKLVLQHLQNRSNSERRRSKGISGLRRLRVSPHPLAILQFVDSK